MSLLDFIDSATGFKEYEEKRLENEAWAKLHDVAHKIKKKKHSLRRYKLLKYLTREGNLNNFKPIPSFWRRLI